LEDQSHTEAGLNNRGVPLQLLIMAVETRSTSSAVATKQDVNELAGKLNTVMETLDKSSSALAEIIMEMREFRKSQ